MEPSGTLSTPSSISTFLLFIVVLYQYQRFLQGPASDHSTVSGTVPGRSPQFSWIAPGRSKNTWLLRVSQNRLPSKVDVLSSFFIIFPVTMGQSGATSDTAKLVKKRMCCPHFRAAGLFKTWQWRSATHEAIDLHWACTVSISFVYDMYCPIYVYIYNTHTHYVWMHMSTVRSSRSK